VDSFSPKGVYWLVDVELVYVEGGTLDVSPAFLHPIVANATVTRIASQLIERRQHALMDFPFEFHPPSVEEEVCNLN